MDASKVFAMVGIGLLLALTGVVQAQDAVPAALETEIGSALGEAGCGPCVGYDNGFFIKSADGCFSLKHRGLIQFRYIADWRDIPAGVPTEDNFEGGFQLNRANLFFSGRIGCPELKYSFAVASNGGNDLWMEEAQIKYEFGNGSEINAGRFRNLAFLREEATSYTRQMSAERSYLNETFTIDYVQGAGWTQQGESAKVQFVVSDGRFSGYTFNNFHTNRTDVALTTRLDLRLAGDWAQMGDFASWCNEDWGVFVGGAFHWEEGETGDNIAVNNLNNFVSWTVDGSIEGYGLSLYAAGVGRHSTNAGMNIDQTGFLAQAAYMVVPDILEPFIRYQSIDFDGFQFIDGDVDHAVADSSVNIVNFGVNRYFNKHAAKLTLVASYAMDPIPVTRTNTGFLADVGGRDDQLTFLTQMQLFY